MNKEVVTRDERDQILKTFRTWLKQYGQLKETTWKVGKTIMSIKKYNKNTCLLKNGQKETHFRFIYSGLLKYEYHQGDKSFISDFAIAPTNCNEAIAFQEEEQTYNSTITTITPVTLIEIKSQDIIKFLPVHPDFHTIASTITNSYVQKMMIKVSSMRHLKAEQRYKYLIENYPSIIKYAKLEDIASFLNIIPSSLSRIRKEALQNKVPIV